MSTYLIWKNVVAYCLQIGLLVGLAAFVPALLRLRLPGAKLVYWHILLATCLLLPLVRPWRQDVIPGDVQVTTTVVAVQPSGPPARSIPWTQVGLIVLAAGTAGRLIWLAGGFGKLRRMRKHSRLLEVGNEIELRLSREVSSPVTFGLRHPVVLLPDRFPQLEPRMRDAILCHELLHVERHDWVFTVAEEIVRAVFWFHPAIWWLLGEIQLAREQAVDREVIARTQSRDEYVDALLAIAGAAPQADLALAPLFLRKRHLKYRVMSILKEVRMSKTRLVSALAAGVGMLAVACWFVTATFPLAAAPQTVNDAAGVSVDLGGSQIIHRAPVAYPENARAKGIQGVVTVDVTLDSTGSVSDAQIVAGPEELRKAALESVLQWHFTRDAANTRRQVKIAFQPPAAAAGREQAKGGGTPRTTVGVIGGVPGGGVVGGIVGGVPGGRTAEPMLPRRLSAIKVTGLSDSVSSDLLSRLPVHEGDTVTPEMMEKTIQAVRDFDEHLRVMPAMASKGAATNPELALVIMAPSSGVQERYEALERLASRPVEPAPATPDRIRVGGNVQQVKLIQQPRPIYPPEAKQARIQGVVNLQAVIAKDGTVKSLEVLSGHPLLVPAALESVRQWVYQPTLLNGNPVEVVTQIDVNFTLLP